MRRFQWSAHGMIVLTAGAVTLGMAASGWAAVDSRACRGAIAKSATKVVSIGYKDALKCRAAQDGAKAATGPCAVPGSPEFDPLHRYSAAKSRATSVIQARCQGGDPVLGNYDNNDPAGAIFPDFDDTIASNQLTTAGNVNLSTGNPPDLSTRIRCVETIARAEAAMVKEIIKGGAKCQKIEDINASSFGKLDPTCLLTGTKAEINAQANITGACAGLNPSDIGTCGPLPDCVVTDTIAAAQTMLQDIYYKKAATSTCGNGVLEGAEQCDDGPNNGQPGDTCNTKCELLTETCGPGTLAGGTLTGHRIVTVSLGGIPASPASLAGVQIAFDYPQLETSIPGTGNSSVVRGAVHVTPTGGFLAVDDTDTDFHFALANTTEFIGGGQLFQVTLDECVAMSQNVCNRNQNVVGCCPAANLDACTNDQNTIDNPTSFANYYDDCHCGTPLKGVSLTDCTTGWKFFTDHGACTTGACASPPATIKCGHGCTAGGSDKIDQACTTNASCFDAGVCDVGGTGLCTAGEPTKIGTACAANTDCDSAAGVCSSGNICTAGDATRIGLACSINNDCGTPLTVATCEACPELGDRTNGTFGCSDVYNGPICKPGDFPGQSVGGCDGTANGPIGGCPLGNTCESQQHITDLSCSLINPVDHLGQPVDGVTCSITVTEAP